ncbi:MAG: 2Fe-2S iron-sulfur cluster binding domain-containing protein [Nitrospira sp.]|nr:2Fe-2S iron-sulfur cluster binding domain-containing protein [bacterium]MBL7048095.1 2Fe-2S iron-sulfur cluster binding domain-containing protein [Nitrospira sp.]
MITGILLISVLTALLALLLEIAYKYIANYGEVQVTINNEKTFEVTGGSPLLSTLMQQAIFLPSACGGKGTCGYCKVKIHEGGGPVMPTETPYLSTEELAQDVRLSCQVKVKTAMQITIPDELFNVREYRIKVDHIEQLTPLIKGLHLNILQPEEGISFVPGQYVQLQVPPYKLSSTPEFRAYSIASSINEPKYIDLIIARMEGGIVSGYIHDLLKEGEELIARGPFGDFHLLTSERDILFIATGSGLAPFIAMLYQIENENIQRKTTLIFGTKRPENLYYSDLLSGFMKRLPDFTFIPVLSRVEEQDSWTGEQGRVTDLINRYIPDNNAVDVHICGLPIMVQSCLDILATRGVPLEQIVYDKFE